ncbi:MAG: NfeD family protein [Caldilineaceae bacterium]|nr:NfeD family protein [Caldilineaceae bacterium]
MVDGTNLMLWLWLVLALLAAVFAVMGRSAMLAGITVAALVAAFAAALPLTLGWQLLTFLVIALLGFLLARIAPPRSSGPSETLFGVERVVGRDAIVIVPIDPKSAQGRVRVENEIWHADSESGQPIPDGTMVQVLSVRGDRVLVRPLPVRPSRQSRFDFDTR